MDKKSICVYDFNGYTAVSHLPVSYWADYVPDEQLIYFGGDWWYEIPPLPCDHIPDSDEVFKLATAYLYYKHNQ